MNHIQEKLDAMSRVRTEYELAFDRCEDIDQEWTSLQLSEIAAGKSPDDAWWGVFQTPRGKELKEMNRIAQFDKVRAGFHYDAVMLAAKALIAMKEEQ